VSGLSDKQVSEILDKMYTTLNAMDQNEKELIKETQKYTILLAKTRTLSDNLTELQKFIEVTENKNEKGEVTSTTQEVQLSTREDYGKFTGTLGAILEQAVNLDLPESI
jgi:hypothetical protein